MSPWDEVLTLPLDVHFKLQQVEITSFNCFYRLSDFFYLTKRLPTKTTAFRLFEVNHNKKCLIYHD